MLTFDSLSEVDRIKMGKRAATSNIKFDKNQTKCSWVIIWHRITIIKFNWHKGVLDRECVFYFLYSLGLKHARLWKKYF
jgi:hypothetical protein